jgi:dTDP-4-amino-4,6-dideoxygalactose transaminase
MRPRPSSRGYKGRPVGGIGHLAALSFHETKNVISGEGGALLVNDPAFATRAEVILEKGTNSSQFFRARSTSTRGSTSGRRICPGEIVAAFLFAQLEHAEEITRGVVPSGGAITRQFEGAEREGLLRRPIVP